MSEEILKALMQLFAVVTYPGDDTNPRRTVVEAFLQKQLNNHRASYFLGLFDLFYSQHQSKFAQKERIPRRIAATSVKALKIASSVNEELTYYQKLIVIIQLVEFLNSAFGVSPVEREFIDNVAQILHIDDDDYRTIAGFVIGNDVLSVEGERFLRISNEQVDNGKVHFLHWNHLQNDLFIASLKSANVLLMRFLGDSEITVNGQLVESFKVHVLKPGATVRGRKCEPIYYSELIAQFRRQEALPQMAFEVDGLAYRFSKKKIGLFPLSFSSQSGHLVGIMGDSGAGKTTLVNLLCGIYKPTSGSVKVNGIDIHREPHRVEGLIGLVSQDDLLMEDLTVFQNLYYNAKLCFDDLPPSRITQKVLKLLEALGLHEIRNMKVGSALNKNISGGQRKRLNIALELIREPSVLFLDEPTSGLSSRDSENIVDLLKELSSKGKLVFVVIHQPSSDVFKMFNQLLVLDTGGYLIYNGDAMSSIPYFKKCMNHANFEEGECPTCGNVNAEQVLNIVHAKVVDEYGSFTPSRKMEPSEWYERYKQNFLNHHITREHDAVLPKLNFRIPNKLKQFCIFLQRDALSKFANKQYLGINLFETPILALLLSLLLRFYDVDAGGGQTYWFAKNPNLAVYIIIAVVIAFFVGLTVSAEEIINDRKILKREAFLNLSRLGYICSKIFLLGVLSALQMALFVVIGNAVMGIEGMDWNYWLILFSTAVFANLLGLLISDTLKKTVNIYILIPFLIIPQLILSGVFVSYDRLNPKFSNPDAIPWYGELITSRWAFEALAVQQYVYNRYQAPFFEPEMLKSQANYMKEYWVPAMRNKLVDCKRMASNHADEMCLLRNELTRDYLHVRQLPFNRLDLLTGNQLGDSANMVLAAYLEKVKTFYRQVYNSADNRIDNIRVGMTNTPEMRSRFMELRNRHFNEGLDRFLRNSDRFFSNKIIEYKGAFVQKSDPIFKEAEGSVLRAHFFAPYKNIFGTTVDTFFANLMVIWVLNLVMFLMLYFKALECLFAVMDKVKLVVLKVLRLE